ETAERIVGAVRNALAHDPTLPLCQIHFTQMGSSPTGGRDCVRAYGLGYGEFSLNAFAVFINVRDVLQRQEFVDDYAQAQADGYLETGTGDAWTDVMLHEICGHGSQFAGGYWDGRVAGVRRADPVWWVEQRADEQLGAAFEALTAAREISFD